MSALHMVGLACIIGGVHVWGLWIGARDAHLMQQAERRAAISRCADVGRLAVLVLRDQPPHDDWLCVGGSARMLRQVQP